MQTMQQLSGYEICVDMLGKHYRNLDVFYQSLLRYIIFILNNLSFLNTFIYFLRVSFEYFFDEVDLQPDDDHHHHSLNNQQHSITVLLPRDRLLPIVVLLQYLLKSPADPLDVHQKLADPSGQLGQLFFARKLAQIVLVDDLKRHVSDMLAFLHKAQRIVACLFVLHL